jgi:hypothetical protein
MPALPVVPNVYRVQFFHKLGVDSNVINRLYFSWATSFTGADATAVANQHYQAWNTNMLTHLTTDLKLLSVVVTDLTTNTGYIGTHTGAATGAVATQSLPAGTCQEIQLVTARRYRGGKPKIYISGYPTADMSDEQDWTGTHINNVTADFAAYVTAAKANVGAVTAQALVAVSYFSGSHVVTNPVTGRARNVSNVRGAPIVDTVLGQKFNTRFASQRRRNLIRP